MCSLEDLQQVLKHTNESKPLFTIEPPLIVFQRKDYESKKKFIVPAQVVKKTFNEPQVKRDYIREPVPVKCEEPVPVKREEPVPVKCEEPVPVKREEPVPTKYKANTLWESLLPWIDSVAPMFTETMKKEASDLFHQYVRDFLMGDSAVQCGKPSAIRACLRAIDTTELKIAIDSVSFTVLAKLFNLLWKCNITLKEKQKEIINNFNEKTTMTIEKCRDGWLISN